jgi:hypothetical protein
MAHVIVATMPSVKVQYVRMTSIGPVMVPKRPKPVIMSGTSAQVNRR